MATSEDDTFRILSRPLYSQLRSEMSTIWPDGGWYKLAYPVDFLIFLKTRHWTEDEFWDALNYNQTPINPDYDTYL